MGGGNVREDNGSARGGGGGGSSVMDFFPNNTHHDMTMTQNNDREVKEIKKPRLPPSLQMPRRMTMEMRRMWRKRRGCTTHNHPRKEGVEIVKVKKTMKKIMMKKMMRKKRD